MTGSKNHPKPLKTREAEKTKIGRRQALARTVFHELSRAEGPSQQGRKTTLQENGGCHRCGAGCQPNTARFSQYLSFSILHWLWGSQSWLRPPFRRLFCGVRESSDRKST